MFLVRYGRDNAGGAFYGKGLLKSDKGTALNSSVQKNRVEILDLQGNVLAVQDISGIDSEKISGLNLSNLCTFDIHEAKVNLKLEPELIVDGWTSPWYSDYPVTIEAPVTVKYVPDGQGKKWNLILAFWRSELLKQNQLLCRYLYQKVQNNRRRLV